jgi:hypothetical protein
LQLSSTPSQVASLVAGVPATQLFRTTPATHEVVPVLAHAPMPQFVAVGT